MITGSQRQIFLRIQRADSLMHGDILASKAPRINRKTIRPAKLLKAAQIIHEIAHPKKQKVIHWLTGNRTKA